MYSLPIDSSFVGAKEKRYPNPGAIICLRKGIPLF